ncbi:K(+)-transporting ATPase subunit C [Nocardioides sp. cx-173]|uniref:K(+)-transporting ATPase subunit C n=1 Tax=Nocardioides sp. cx-173 TaxID=2898796 RepID=UPI001E3B6511|nr:K(+)-transporting ATPase subunit C [Nocardioides sp. cx-173]MCD4523555.1 K(+)-transporting ATPase subunit C [Nocardioides sp. cx-173]UGB42107.1 K(+)-transporting ATPase subunit C [Nocardioides sp. cx-173]
MKDLYALFRHSLAGLRMLLAATVVCGVAYPLLVTGVAQVVFPWQADGSLVTEGGEHADSADEAVGASLIGQLTESDGLFHPRPSAAGDGYDLLSTYGSNHGPESAELVEAIEERRSEVAAREGVEPAQVPVDALTASGSGIDPHISEAYADLQVSRVAASTGLSEDEIRRLVLAHTEGRTWGVLGETRVNVLRLNIDVLAASGGGAG